MMDLAIKIVPWSLRDPKVRVEQMERNLQHSTVI